MVSTNSLSVEDAIGICIKWLQSQYWDSIIRCKGECDGVRGGAARSPDAVGNGDERGKPCTAIQSSVK